MDIRQLKKIVEMVESANIQELEIEEEGLCIRVRKNTEPSYSYPPQMMQQPVYHTEAPAMPQAAAPAPAASTAAPAAPDTSQQITINSPMVGTFYRSPSPDAAPFVQVGSVVEEETVVCILEAMKVMNEIKAGQSGKIAEILVSNAEAVEYGQPLFRLESA